MWKSLSAFAPHLGVSLRKGYNKTKALKYLTEKNLLSRDSYKNTIRYDFVNKDYGFRKVNSLRFYSIEKAKEFFIEAEFLKSDGTELDYEATNDK